MTHYNHLLRELDGRMISVVGFLDILHTQLGNIKNTSNSTQKMASESVAFEILGNIIYIINIIGSCVNLYVHFLIQLNQFRSIKALL